MLRAVLAPSLAAAALALAAAPAGAQLPVGEAEGVRVVSVGETAVVVFTARAERLRRRLAGKIVSVACETRSRPDEQGLTSSNEYSAGYRVPKRGRRIRLGFQRRGLYLCSVAIPERTIRRKGTRTTYPERVLVTIPLSQGAAVYLDEKARAQSLDAVLLGAAVDASRRGLPGYPPSQDFAARARQVTRPVRLGIVALASPADTPPAGSVGYYSDGTERVAAVVLSASGRRLFIEYEGDGVIRSNVVGYIFGEDD